ncbi:hypothetical protein [Prosthecobacter sp.]|uniref:hypothetical protein n=1 Tax=Prosthecobacter sp. TaxID=1965333 RepID=UPI003783B78E
MNPLDPSGYLFWLILAFGLLGLVRRRRSRSATSDTLESRFVIHLSETEVSCHRPDGMIESVRWDDLQKVEVLTNSDGPLLPDVFWLLHGTEKGCCIPQGATGDGALLDRLQ